MRQQTIANPCSMRERPTVNFSPPLSRVFTPPVEVFHPLCRKRPPKIAVRAYSDGGSVLPIYPIYQYRGVKQQFRPTSECCFFLPQNNLKRHSESLQIPPVPVGRCDTIFRDCIYSYGDDPERILSGVGLNTTNRFDRFVVKLATETTRRSQ